MIKSSILQAQKTTFSENHARLETPSIEEQLETSNSSGSSYEVKKNDKVHVVNNNISESKLDPTSKVDQDQVAIANNNNNLSSHSKVINTHTNSNVSQKQHQNVLQIEDNPLLLSTNSLGDSSTSQSSNVNHNKPIVQCNIQGLKFNALLDACSTGPEGYIVNYIHPEVVQQIKNHQSKIKTPFIKKCNCLRASTCTGAGCFETSTCITLNIYLFDEIIKAEMLLENISFRISRGIPYDIIIGNFTFRDYDLSKIFRHFFTSSNPIINQSSRPHSSNSSSI
jgi:hypothetical protein